MFVALFAVEPTERTTLKSEPYCKKFAAVKNDVAVLLSGLPNISTNWTSLLIVIISFTGPQLKFPAKPPIVVAVEGTTVVRSTSETFTPGDN